MPLTTTPGTQHPNAAAQATAAGRTLSVLKVIDGRVYAGYGDFDTNTGPIHVMSVPLTDPLGAWTDHLTAATEQIWGFCQLSDGRIFAPHVDPQGGAENPGGYAERQVNGVWVDRNNVPGAMHCFDCCEFGGRLFIAGGSSDAGHAVVWQSTDGGATWTESLRHPFEDNFGRFYFLAPVGDKLYVKSPDNVSYEWTAVGGWVESAVDPIPDYQNGGPGKPWRDGYLIHSGPQADPSGLFWASLVYFDGVHNYNALLGQFGPPSVRDFDVDANDNLYYLTHDGKLRRIGPDDPPGHYAEYGTFAESIQSVAVVPGVNKLLLGGTDSRLHQLDLNGLQPTLYPIPPPPNPRQVKTASRIGVMRRHGLDNTLIAAILGVGADELADYIADPSASVAASSIDPFTRGFPFEPDAEYPVGAAGFELGEGWNAPYGGSIRRWGNLVSLAAVTLAFEATDLNDYGFYNIAVNLPAEWFPAQVHNNASTDPPFVVCAAGLWHYPAAGFPIKQMVAAEFGFQENGLAVQNEWLDSSLFAAGDFLQLNRAVGSGSVLVLPEGAVFD